MAFSPLSVMQYTHDMKDESHHAVNKIAATITGTTKTGELFHITRANFYPEAIVTKIGKDVKIGNASGSIHAETALLLEVLMTQGLRSQDAKIYVTDPCCPNCAKNMVEAGITEVYIDSTGFEEDYYQRRKEDFEKMSLRIFEEAGVAVHVVNRATQAVEPLLKNENAKTIFSDIPVTPYDDKLNAKKFKKHVEEEWGRSDTKRVFAIAASNSPNHKYSILSASEAFVTGHKESPDDYVSKKYSFKLQPVNKIMMAMARLGFTPNKSFIFSSQVPTSREFVDMVGAGYRSLLVGDMKKARDKHGLKAMGQLRENNVLDISEP